MNTARLGRKGTPISEENDYPAAGLVRRGCLDKQLAQFEAPSIWKMVGRLGVQIVIFSLSAKYL